MAYKYAFAKIKKVECPKCKHKTFSSMKLIETSEITDFGRCERKDNCGYDNYPTANKSPKIMDIKEKPIIEVPQNFIDKDLVEKSLSHYENNVLISELNKRFPNHNVFQKAYEMGVGTGKNGSTIFFQYDFEGRVWNGKRMFFLSTLKRNKDIHPTPLFTASNGFLRYFFGLRCFDSSKRTVLVESEKTAFLGAVFIDDCNYISYGGSNGLTLLLLTELKKNGVNVIIHYHDCDKAGRAAKYKCDSECEILGIKCISAQLDSYCNIETGEVVKDVQALNLTAKNKSNRYDFLEGFTSSREKGFDLGDLILEKYDNQSIN